MVIGTRAGSIENTKDATMIRSASAAASRRKLAGAAVLAFATGGLLLSWVGAHATSPETITISAPAIKVASRHTPTKVPLPPRQAR